MYYTLWNGLRRGLWSVVVHRGTVSIWEQYGAIKPDLIFGVFSAAIRVRWSSYYHPRRHLPHSVPLRSCNILIVGAARLLLVNRASEWRKTWLGSIRERFRDAERVGLRNGLEVREQVPRESRARGMKMIRRKEWSIEREIAQVCCKAIVLPCPMTAGALSCKSEALNACRWFWEIKTWYARILHMTDGTSRIFPFPKLDILWTHKHHSQIDRLLGHQKWGMRWGWQNGRK